MNEILIVVVVLGLISYSFWDYVRLALMKFVQGNWRVKMNSSLCVLAIAVLFSPSLISFSFLWFVYLYAVAIIGVNGYFLYKAFLDKKRYLPKGTVSVFISFILLLLTPVADILLNRSYDARAAVLFSAATLAGTLLHIWFVYLTHKELRASLDQKTPQAGIP